MALVWALFTPGGYTPLGLAEVDSSLARELSRLSGFGYIPEAHVREHSVEVQVPFIQKVFPGARIVPVVMGYQTEPTVQALAGAWTGPPEVVELAGAAGGVARLDRALAAFVDARAAAEEAFAGLPAALRDAVLRRIREGRFGRRQIGLIPKLGARTLGIDFLA